MWIGPAMWAYGIQHLLQGSKPLEPLPGTDKGITTMSYMRKVICSLEKWMIMNCMTYPQFPPTTSHERILQKTVQQFSCEFHLPQTHLVPITVWIQHISSITFRTYSTWVNSGLLTIDDQPGNPWAWKASCFTSPKTLNFSPREQLFLLYKHLAYKQNKLVQ